MRSFRLGVIVLILLCDVGIRRAEEHNDAELRAVNSALVRCVNIHNENTRLQMYVADLALRLYEEQHAACFDVLSATSINIFLEPRR